MSEEKQKIISDICPFYKEYGTCEQCNTEIDIDGEPCYFECMANAIVDNCYRKQRWISVEEQEEPTKNGTYLCYGYWIGSGRSHMDTADFFGEWKIVNNFVLTHWMPLPEPPKMKGGAE